MNKENLIIALRKCGVSGSIKILPFVAQDPSAKKDGDSVRHDVKSVSQWFTIDRNGLITHDLRATEFIGLDQKILPYGGKVKYFCPTAKKELWKDAPQEVEYSDFRFSQYGTG